MPSLIKISNLCKTYDDGFVALDNINLDIQEGEIIALLGPNGAGKTTLISIICGIVNPGRGSVTIGGYDSVRDYRATRELIGLVPQELSTDAFETVFNTVSFSRGLFGKAPNPAHIENTLKALSLWDKKQNRIMELSGGMKRRVMIAKALSLTISASSRNRWPGRAPPATRASVPWRSRLKPHCRGAASSRRSA